jgi:hypothetical protein
LSNVLSGRGDYRMNDKEIQEIRREHEIFKQECEDWDNYVKNQNRIQLIIFMLIYFGLFIGFSLWGGI